MHAASANIQGRQSGAVLLQPCRHMLICKRVFEPLPSGDVYLAYLKLIIPFPSVSDMSIEASRRLWIYYQTVLGTNYAPTFATITIVDPSTSGATCSGPSSFRIVPRCGYEIIFSFLILPGPGLVRNEAPGRSPICAQILTMLARGRTFSGTRVCVCVHYPGIRV
ncbi:hypothetical protein ZHAS_00009756 [Anopheles sinensis]|uniref:Uncharacterized protein n=1 Tax=Anopheles sinensis TaxID=74873 RepID=A0A084VVV2_ANOSI|nr:hypothetical protein ZHAS_00009756 [Anopheles sinensis]